MHHPFIIGEKVYLRGIEESDAEGPYLDWLNDVEVTRFLETAGRFPTSKESLLDYIRSMAQSDQDVLFGIHDITTDELIGTSHLGPINWVTRISPIGIMIGNKKLWGKGYASEAIELVVGYAFRRLNLHKVTAGAAAINQGSVKAFEKAGFKIEGRAKSQVLLDGEYYDSQYLGLTKQDFMQEFGSK